MFIFLGIGLSALLGCLFIVSYILIEKFRSLKLFFRWPVYQELKQAFEGIVYGFLIILFKLIFISLNPAIILPVFIIGVLILALFRNVIVALFAIIGPLIYQAIAFTINLQFYIVLTLMFLFLVFVQVIKYFFDDWFINLNLIGGFLCLAFLSALTYDFIVNKYLTSTTFEIIFIPFLGLLIVDIEMRIAIKFLVSANILYKSVHFNFSKYYRESLKTDVIGDFISENKVLKGIYGIFKFSYAHFENKAQNIEIKESILLDLEKAFPKDTILFLADEKHYGFFYPFLYANKNEIPKMPTTNLPLMLKGNSLKVRSENDFLKFLENILNRRTVIYLTSWKERVLVKVKVGISLYGVHSWSINELHHFADFALYNEQNVKTNLIQLFNPQDYFKSLTEEQLLNQMDSTIGLDNFITNLMPIVDTKTHKPVLYFLNIDKIEYSELKESVRTYINFLSWSTIFDRHMAYLALSQYQTIISQQAIKTAKLAFFYTPKILEQDFRVAYFKQKIQQFDISWNKIILIFDPYGLKQVENYQIFIKNLIMLKKLGVSCGIINVNDFSTQQINDINPEYYFVVNRHNNDEIKIVKNKIAHVKIVLVNITQEKDWHFINTWNVNLADNLTLEKITDHQKSFKKSKM